jgi:cytochrome P450
MVLRLLQNRDLWEMLVAEPGLAEVAVEESLRFDSPVLGLFRTTTKPIECRGVAIPGGAKVMLLYGSADHDDDVFDDPETFRLDRDLTRLRRQHLAFGAGVHFCLGAPLARLEGRIALETLVRRVPTLDLAGAPGRIEPFLLYGQRPMPVRW